MLGESAHLRGSRARRAPPARARWLAPDGTEASPCFLLPGFRAGDGSTWLPRKFLRYLGWSARGWGLGVNDGDAAALLPARPRSSNASPSGAASRCTWSAGAWAAFFAREIARDRPDLVAQVVTMGTPVVGGAKYTAVAPLFRSQGYDIDAWSAECARRARAGSSPGRSPRSTAAATASSRGRRASTARIRAWSTHVGTTHLGFGFDLRVWRIIAERPVAVTRAHGPVRR